MKKFVGLFAFALFASCYAPKRNCKDFKNGTFVFEYRLDGELVKTKFTRKDSLEIDYFQGEVDSSSVRWINDCEYILTNLHPENKIEEKPINIKILTTDKDSYTFEFWVVGSTNTQQGTAIKIE